VGRRPVSNKRLKADNLPSTLREEGRFCVQKAKIPYNPRTGGKAKSNDPTTFSTFEQAMKALENGSYDGIGVGVFGNLGAIDIDHCVSDTGKLSSLAADIVNTMDAYTEYSPSGKGLHILFTMPEDFVYSKVRYYINRQEIGLEVYIAGATKKYITVTGNAMTPGYSLEERAEQLRIVLEKYMVRPNQPASDRMPSGVAVLEDADLIVRAKQSKNGATFTALWNGDAAAYQSSSEADMALCNMLAFWTNKNATQMDRLFRQSGLMRDKWDRPQSGSTYGALTIQNAINSVHCVHCVPEWEKPIPFSAPNTPDFPIESLPGAVSAFVKQLAESTQTPEEMAGVLSLGILATAFQSKYEVEVTPDWMEPLCLYPIAVASPGERKSKVISALTGPVYEYEAEQRDFEAAEIARNQTERALLEKRLQAVQNCAAKGKNDFEAKRQEALDLSAQLANFKELHPFRLMMDDTTPEKLTDVMAMQGGSITVASAEGGIFDVISGRYDRTINLDIFLKGHAGDTISVDRIGRKSNYIAKPRLTMILTVQPTVLYGLMNNATFRGRGLCGRFLYAICKSKVGRRKVSPAPMSSTTRAEYRQFVRHILANQGSGIVRLSADANTIREEYQSYIEKKLGGEWEYMRDWGGKLVGTMVRIAALLHLSCFPSDTPISAETMEAATDIAEFLGAHAEAAYQAMGADESLENAKYLWRQITSKGGAEMSKRDLFRLVRGKFKKVESLDAPLHVLVEYGYIRIEKVERDGDGKKVAGRKASPMIKINPLAYGHNGQNGHN